MYRAMMLCALSEQWMMLKKRKSELCLSIFLILLIQMQFLPRGFVFAIVLLILWYTPIGVDAAMHICPLDEKWKIRYLYLQTFLKISLGFLVVAVMQTKSAGMSMEDRAVYAGWLFFLLWDVSVLSGVFGAREKEIDKRGYEILSKASEAYLYWTAALGLEGVYLILYRTDCLTYGQNIHRVVFLLLFLLDIWVIVRYTRQLMWQMTSYETVYCHKPDEREGIAWKY